MRLAKLCEIDPASAAIGTLTHEPLMNTDSTQTQQLNAFMAYNPLNKLYTSQSVHTRFQLKR